MFITNSHHLHSHEVDYVGIAIKTESDYVRKEPFRKRGPYLAGKYADVDAEEEEYGDRTDYR